MLEFAPRFATKWSYFTVSMNASTVQALIQAGLPGAQVEVQGADGVHFEALVVCESFTGKSTLTRHRMVYATLGARMGGEIHALALRTLTPSEHASRG